MKHSHEIELTNTLWRLYTYHMRGSFFYRFFISKIALFLRKHPYVGLFLALLYLISPLDLLPEAFTGPLGYIDDLFILIMSAMLFNKLKAPPIVAQSQSLTKKSPYDVLEIPRKASGTEIKAAYRRKMLEYHPDKVAHLGAGLKKTAKEKTLEIQRAYEELV